MKTKVDFTKAIEIITDSDIGMSLCRITPEIDGTPIQDEICLVLDGYISALDVDISDQCIFVSMSEAKRLIGILKRLTKDENEHKGINPETTCERRTL
jgi:hypothetical protein